MRMHLFMSVLVFMLDAHLRYPAALRRGRLQPLFVILMSHYIFVWAWADETRSVKHVVTPVLLEFHPPVRLTHVTMGFVLIEKISVDSPIRSAGLSFFSLFFFIFSIKKRIYLPRALQIYRVYNSFLFRHKTSRRWVLIIIIISIMSWNTVSCNFNFSLIELTFQTVCFQVQIELQGKFYDWSQNIWWSHFWWLHF